MYSKNIVMLISHTDLCQSNTDIVKEQSCASFAYDGEIIHEMSSLKNKQEIQE